MPRDCGMGNAATQWFSPAPSEVGSSRISLDFELRKADQSFRELVVPGLGRLWFARQISWPLAALSLHEDLSRQGSNAPKPTVICRGIEALACKLEYVVHPQDPSPRILGRRAFGRDAGLEVWSFHRLCQATNYVRNTHRQAATRALRVEGGLGFARGSQFDLLELEPVGRALAGALLEQRVGKGGSRLRDWLLRWLRGERDVPAGSETLLRALSPEHATDDERAMVRARLLETSTPQSEKRQRLALAIGRASELPSIEDEIVPRLREAGHREQADEVVAARAFGAMLDRARDALARITRAVESARGGARLATLARDSALEASIETLRIASTNYLEKANTARVEDATSRKFDEARSFAEANVSRGDTEVLREIVRRSRKVLDLADDFVIRGPLFRVVDGADEASDLEDGAASIEPDRTGRTFRIANFHSLLRDVDPRGAR